MEHSTCETCLHFRRHYGISDGRIFRIHCGHCVYPKTRRKQPTANACQFYEPTTPVEDAFVTKHYLTKELLQHLLNMELLPPIEDAPTFPYKK